MRSPIWTISAVVVLSLASAAPQPMSIFGFSAAGSKAQREIERRFLDMPSADQIRDAHKYLTDKPHMAGSPRDRELAEWTRDRWREYGLEDVEIAEHEVLLPYPEEVTVEMTAPRAWRASMKEDAVPGDPYSSANDVGIPYHAYSASGEATGEVVYAGSGNPTDYDSLASRGIDVRGKIALVRYSVPYSYRGFKVLTAQQRGLAGVLIYSDPADDGYRKGKTYPDGPWGPESHIQRGGVVYDFLVPGDPLTPGWASVPGARRIEKADAAPLPKIMSAPLSWKDARPILEALGGDRAPDAWQGGLPITYHVGPGPATVRMRLRMDDRIRPIWTVTGSLRGSSEPESLVVVGNHRDAWIYGGVDPSSGSAAIMELARTLGTLARQGARPRRTIVFASWDAEEFTLTSSTEWGEQNEARLRERAIAYLNVDSAASGPNFRAAAVPALNRLITEAAEAVRDPRARTSIAAARRSTDATDRGSLPSASDEALVSNRLGSGSDYTVFLNFLGVPIVDMTFNGPYGVYHSVYDNHLWVSRIGDPGFLYHRAMVQLWGVAVMRLANAEGLPLDYRPYAERIREFLDEVDRQWLSARPVATDSGAYDVPDAPADRDGGSPELAPARQALRRLSAAAANVAIELETALKTGSRDRLDRLNGKLRAAERGFLDPAGIPGRAWYRHLIFAPKFTYAPEVLPGVAEAIQTRDPHRVAEQAHRLAAALDRAALALK